ncbi:MAG: CooT family nickel-binding protein [Eubacteriales bacterium]
MCLGKLFIEKEAEPLMENISNLAIENGRLVFTSLFGEKQSFVGEVKEIDFNNSKIIMKQES